VSEITYRRKRASKVTLILYLEWLNVIMPHDIHCFILFSSIHLRNVVSDQVNTNNDMTLRVQPTSKYDKNWSGCKSIACTMSNVELHIIMDNVVVGRVVLGCVVAMPPCRLSCLYTSSQSFDLSQVTMWHFNNTPHDNAPYDMHS
jgi:hypothetical protein